MKLTSVLRHLRMFSEPEARDLSDGELLERFRSQREEAALALLVQRHGPMVLGVCRRLLREAHAAEDAFQATFLILLRKAWAIRKLDSVASWLHGVARWVALKARCRAARIHALERRYGARPRCGPSGEAAWNELCAVLDEELDALPEKYRAPLVLCGLEGKTQEQAARDLNCPRISLSSRLSRARALLQERLARRGITPGAAVLGGVLTEDTRASVSAQLTLATVQAATAHAASGASANVALLAGEGSEA
jgi:RNA polymerase sigma factor (sigma-70 family)